jgi:DNA-binding beta-propeller fold protein YncE
VQEFDSSGTYVTQWGGVGTGNGQFTGAYGIAVNPNGDVYVSDNGSSCRVEKFTSSGGYLGQWGSCLTNPNNLDTENCSVYGIAIGADGKVFEADAGCNMVKGVTATGALLFRSGTTLGGTCEPGVFSTPYGVAVDRLGNLYVASTGSHCIQKFGPGGSTPAHSKSWGHLKLLYR